MHNSLSFSFSFSLSLPLARSLAPSLTNQVWVAIWNSWNTTDPTITPNSLYIATSLDGLHFSTPRVLVTPKCKNSKAWHATVISAEGGSEYAGKRAKLYHSDCWTQDTGVGIYKDGREWVERDIEFERADGS